MINASRRVIFVLAVVASSAFALGIAPVLRDLTARLDGIEQAVTDLQQDVAEIQARSGGIGVSDFAASTGAAIAVEGGPPVVIPGLERIIDVEQDSKLLIALDVREWSQLVHTCPGWVDGRRGEIELELDGAVVATREFFGDFGNLSNVLSHTLVWLSEPLPEGQHAVRALIHAAPDDADATAGETTSCFGTDTSDGRQARIVLLEVRS